MTVYCLNTLLASSSRQLLVLIMEYRDTPFFYRAMDKHLGHTYSALVYLVTQRANSLPKPQAGRQHHFFIPGCARPFLRLVYSFQQSCVLQTVFLDVETQLSEDKWFIPWALSGRSLCQVATNGWDGNHSPLPIFRRKMEVECDDIFFFFYPWICVWHFNRQTF